VQTLELSMFGAPLHQFNSELKGAKLLDKKRFKWAEQDQRMDQASRRKHAFNFLHNGQQRKSPHRDEFTAYGQACLELAKGAIRLLRDYEAMLFAAVIPRLKKPKHVSPELLRKDLVFLLERYFYFLAERQEMGLLVMDGSEKQADRKFLRRMERYFLQSMIGQQRTQWIVPVPFFVESDMAYGIQIADLCIYALNWGWRLSSMTEQTRPEIEPFVQLLKPVIWHGEGSRDGNVYKTHGAFYVPDPYQGR